MLKKRKHKMRAYTHAGQVTTFKNKHHQQQQQTIGRFKSGSMACAIIHGFQR